MFKKNTGLKDTPLLISAQGIHWSRQRLLAVASQLSMLVITVILITNVLITLGERRLQEEWAVQRYSELQTVGALLADKISFQQFRTQMFAKSEYLRQYLDNPGHKEYQRLMTSWDSLKRSTPELLDLALFDADGKFRIATSNTFGSMSMPPALLGNKRNLGGQEIYTSALEFAPIDGRLEPYIYQLAWLENQDQSVRGYLVTYNSMLQMLQAIKPAFSSNASPLLLFDNQGLLYAGASDLDPLARLPETMGSSIRQSYPALWSKMARSNFGQFHGEDATFVYLKVQLASQNDTKREYLLLSYIRNHDIASRFFQWRNILLACAAILTILATAVILLTHMFRLEQRARQNSIELARGLFRSNLGCVLVNPSGRIVSANATAARTLQLEQDELPDRSLQRILQLEDELYSSMKQQLADAGEWRGEVQLESLDNAQLRLHIRRYNASSQTYLLITFEDIGELKQAQQEAFLSKLLTGSNVATALTTPSGQLLKVNEAFDKLMQLNGDLSHSLAALLENDLGNQWQRISQLVSMQGQWQGQILCTHSHGSCLQATLKGYLDEGGEIEYLVCTLEQATPRGKIEASGDLVPHRSTILVNLRDLDRYFKSMSEEEKLQASLLLMDISPEGMLSHMSDIGQLENRQHEVEMQLLRDLPNSYQMSHWQLGKLIIILPETDANQAHHYAVKALANLGENGLAEGICIGIAAYLPGQSLEQFLGNAEVALKRAKQTGEQNICQAYTRQL
ncbi:PAS domain-containing protein [Shewanella algae]